MAPTVTDNDLVSEAARPSQLSSSPKSVHFNHDTEDITQESIHLLQKPRSPQNTSHQPSHPARRPPGKLKKPSVIVSTRYNGKIDDTIQPFGNLESDRPRTDESSTYNSSGESVEGRDNRKRSTLSNSDQTAQSAGSVQERLKNGRSVRASSRSRKEKWSEEDSRIVTVLRDAQVPGEQIQKVCA